MADKRAQCKRCGAVGVGWAQSKRTGKWYLALATPTHSIMVEGKRCGETGYQVHPQTPHRCDEPNRGGFDACPDCGRHHVVPMGAPANVRAEWCERYNKAPLKKQEN